MTEFGSPSISSSNFAMPAPPPPSFPCLSTNDPPMPELQDCRLIPEQHAEAPKSEVPHENLGSCAVTSGRDDDRVSNAEEEVYEVENVLKKRIFKGELQYLIKWKGWPHSANSWEPVHNVQGCAEIIQEFEASLTNKKGRNKRKGGVLSLTPNVNMRNWKMESRSAEDETIDSATNSNSAAVSIHRANARTETAESIDILHPVKPEIDMFSTMSGAVEREKKFVAHVPQSLDHQEKVMVKSEEDFDMKSCEVDRKFSRNGSGDVTGGHSELVPYSSPDTEGTDPPLAEIVAVVNCSYSCVDGKEDVELRFRVVRADGVVVLRDNKFLKANYPSLLIEYYEKHLLITRKKRKQ